MTKEQKQQIRQMVAEAKVHMATTMDEIGEKFMEWANKPENKSLKCSFRDYVGDNTST